MSIWVEILNGVDMFGNIKGYARLVKDHFYAKEERRKNPGLFEEINSYCMFIGYPRSSHSLMGSLIDAHPNAIIAHEQDVLKYVKYGFSKEQIFHLLLRNSREFTQKGRTWTGYSYAVPDQFQGKYTTLNIIGDKRGANSARRFKRKPELLKKLQETIGLPIKMIHVMRNPYDNISTMAYRNNGSKKENVTKEILAKETQNYFELVETVYSVQQSIGEEHIIDIKIEEFMSSPKEGLGKLCDFLGLKYDEKYINDCASIVYNKPHKTRNDYPWDEELIKSVKEKIEKYPFLKGYEFTL